MVFLFIRILPHIPLYYAVFRFLLSKRTTVSYTSNKIIGCCHAACTPIGTSSLVKRYIGKAYSNLKSRRNIEVTHYYKVELSEICFTNIGLSKLWGFSIFTWISIITIVKVSRYKHLMIINMQLALLYGTCANSVARFTMCQYSKGPFHCRHWYLPFQYMLVISIRSLRQAFLMGILLVDQCRSNLWNTWMLN